MNLDIEDLNDSPFHFHLKNKKGMYIACNKRVITDAGFNKSDDLLGLTDFDFSFLPEKQAKEFRYHDMQAQRTAKGAFFIEPLTLPHSNKLVAISYKAPLVLKSNKVIGTKSLSFIVDAVDINSPEMAKRLSKSSSIDTIDLTVRQSDCLYYLVRGMTMKQIALELNLSPKNS
jgi:hypothetical protein